MAVFPGCSAAVQAYNGQRGVLFDDDWRFNLGDVQGGEGESFNDGSWRSLNLPHDWSIESGFSTGGIMDGNDHFVATADSDVAFTVSGPGEIVGVDNGSSPDTPSFKEHHRAAFSGKVLAIVQSTGEAGTITITAESSGLSTGEITVNAN